MPGSVSSTESTPNSRCMNRRDHSSGVSDRKNNTQRACVHALEHHQRRLNGTGARIGKLSPEGLVIGLDGGFGFSDRELGANVPIDVRVGELMNHLANGPAFRAIRRIQLRAGEPGDRGSQFCGRLGELSEIQRPVRE